MRLRIAHLDLEEALRHAIHLLDLPTPPSEQAGGKGGRRRRRTPAISTDQPTTPGRTHRLLAPAEEGLVKDAAARKGGHGRHRRPAGVGADAGVVVVGGREKGNEGSLVPAARRHALALGVSVPLSSRTGRAQAPRYPGARVSRLKCLLKAPLCRSWCKQWLLIHITLNFVIVIQEHHITWYSMEGGGHEGRGCSTNETGRVRI